MIDIHAHVVWGVDDGPRSLEDSLALLEAAAAAGTTEIVATPHANPEYPYELEIIEDRLAVLRARMTSRIAIHRGCDFHLSRANIDEALADPAKFAIAGGQALLVEFSDLAIFKSSEHDLSQLREAGLMPIITHPERNPLLRQRKPLLERWVGQGCRIQVTGSAYLGRFGRKAQAFAEELTEAGLVHFVASDAHDTKHRPPALEPVFATIERSWGVEVARALLVENPGAAVRGETDAIRAVPAKRRRWWRRMF